MNYERAILDILAERPGLSGYQIHCALRSRSRSASWFGADAILTHLFGPSSGGMYVALAKLERSQRVYGIWGLATPERGGHRPIHYFPRGSAGG